MILKILNSKGFSLTELVVGVGIMGIVSLGVMEMTNNQQRMKNFGKTKSVEETIVKQARLNLLTAAACEENLLNISIPTILPSLRDTKGREVLVVGQEFGTANDKVVIDQIAVRTFSGAPAAEGDALIFLDFTTTRVVKGSPDRQFTKSFLMRVEIHNGNQIKRCNTSIAAVPGNIAEEFCATTAGSWDSSTEICSYAVVPNCPPYPGGASNQILTKSCWTNFEDTVLEDEYINRVGGETIDAKIDMLNNTLNVTGEVRVNGGTGSLFCANGNCRDFTADTCVTSTISRGVLGNGHMACQGPITCGSTEYFQGFDGSGNMICRPIRSGACGDLSQYVVEVRSDGTVNCDELPPQTPEVPPADGSVSSIPASGPPVYNTDNYLNTITCPVGLFVNSAIGSSPQCFKPMDRHVYAQVCDTGFAVKSYDAGTGTINCERVACVSVWTPDPSTVCNGQSFTQSDGCGFYRDITGTQSCSCTDTSWSPAPSTICSSTSFTQTSNCGRTRTEPGTKPCTASSTGTWITSMCNSSECIEDAPYSGSTLTVCPMPHSSSPVGQECSPIGDVCRRNVGSDDFYFRTYYCQDN